MAILVSGDGDFAYPVQAVENLGRHVELAALPANLSEELADGRQLFTPDNFTAPWSRGRPSTREETRQRQNGGGRMRGWRLGRRFKDAE